MGYFSELECLKRKAARRYKKYYIEFDSTHGGHNIGQMMNPRMSKLAKEFDNVMAEIKVLDPNAPSKFKLTAE